MIHLAAEDLLSRPLRSITGIGSGLSYMTRLTSAIGLRRSSAFRLLRSHVSTFTIYSTMKIAKIRYYGGSREKVCRLGLAHIFLELQEILISTEIRILDKRKANGAAVVREKIDASFGEFPDWVQSKSGDIDWVKRLRFNQTIVTRMGVEIQVSGRSNALSTDMVHIRNSLQDSIIDVA